MCKYFLNSLVFSFLIIFSLFGGQPELLKNSDINKIMEQIFSQHVNQKEMTTSIVKSSFKNYIDQFDPHHIYLLDSEVSPYLNLSENRLIAIENEYKKGNYPAYEELNQLFQKAISRARSYRSLMELENGQLFKEALGHTPVHHEGFAKNEQELKQRMKDNMVHFLKEDIQRYGAKGVEQHLTQVLAVYESAIRTFEEGYNYRLNNGEMLSDAKQENLFSLHVLKSLARSLDAHTSIYNPEEAYDMKVHLEKGFEGIGIVFQQSGDGVVVSNIVKNGPAEKSGQVLVKDEVLEVNGIDVKNLPFEKLIEQVRSTDKDHITLVLSRKNKNSEQSDKVTVTLKPEPIMMDDDRVDVSYENFGNGIIGRITLHSFYQNDQGITSEKDVRKAIEQLDKEGNLRGLVLDLRENSGGFLSQAVKVAGLFITNGVVVISKYSNGEEKFYRDMDGKIAYNGPLVILTSRATASAAEIVAQALQDYGVALVVGDDRTYGKGTIQSQTITDHENAASYFKVTVGKYYTPSGKTPQLHGVKADIVVPGPFSKAHIGEEYLEYAIKQEDKIPEAFSDKLIDIDPSLKSWYLKYYMPTVQHKQVIWKELVPILSKNSTWRIAHNKNYQLFFQKLDEKVAAKPSPEDEEDIVIEKNFGAGDLQMTEAVNILKDMIYLQSKIRHNEYMVGSEGTVKSPLN